MTARWRSSRLGSSATKLHFDPLASPVPSITLYSWRTSQLDLGVIWSSFGFRSEPISDETEEAIYLQVLAAAQASEDRIEAGHKALRLPPVRT